MGRVISADTQKGASTPALTETGQGGLFSTGYLRDDPAGAYVGEGETVAFVVTNTGEGVARERDDERTAIVPGDGYRTIGVVTDRRVIVLVGDADGDERVTLPLIEVDDAEADDGDLVVEMGSGDRWRLHAGDGGVDDVATYVRRMARTWDELEAELDSIKRELVAATAARDDGEYAAGIESAQSAYDRLDAAAALVADLADEWPAGALEGRIDHVRDRCVQTVADARLGHGRALADDAEERWRDEQWEAAFDAYERARAEFDAVAALDADRHDESEALERDRERVEEAMENLAEAPLQRAIDADRRATESDDPATTIADWRTAREWYQTTLELDEDEPKRRFAGDAEKVRTRLDTVTDRIFAIAADDGAEALAAGKWFLDADRPGVACEEAAVAVAIFEDALSVARDVREDEVEELEAWYDDARETLAAATDAASVDEGEATDADEATVEGETSDVDEGRDEEGGAPAGADDETGDKTDDVEVDSPSGETPEPGPDPIDGDRHPDEGSPVDEPVGLDDRPAEVRLEAVADLERIAAATTPDETHPDAGGAEVVGDGAGVAAHSTGADGRFSVRVRALAPEGFDKLARALVESMGWTPEDAPEDAPFDLLATRDEPEGTVAVRTVHRPMAGPLDVDQVEDAARLHDERSDGGQVMIVTSSGVTEAAVRAARDLSVRLIDEDYIATALAAQRTDDLFERIRPQPSD